MLEGRRASADSTPRSVAIENYRRSGANVWLVAALIAPGDPRDESLTPILTAARAVPREDPAYASARYHRLRLLSARGAAVYDEAVSLAADLASKYWAKSNLSGYDTKARALRKFEVIKDHVDFVFAQNPGGAWSFLRSLPDTLRRPFFLVVSAAAIVFIVSIYRRVYADQRAMKWGLPLALGGAMGNLVDRIRYGWVVDFIDFYVKRGGREHHWPTFNVADVAIVVGVGLMAIDMIGSRGHRGKLGELHEAPAPAPVPPAA